MADHDRTEQLGPPPHLDEVEVRPVLRADLLTPTVTAVPGQPVQLTVQVHNTSEVIETIEVDLLALLPESVVQRPGVLTLFPDETARVDLEVVFHRTLPAGTHEGIVRVVGASGTTVPAELALTVAVPSTSAMQLEVEPPVRTGGKRASFDLQVRNTGNTPLDVVLQATDADRVLELHLPVRKLDVRVDQEAFATLVVSHKRPWTGAPREHVLTVQAEAGSLEESAEARFVQRAILTPGVITVLTLLLIVALWAAAMVFGVTRALGPAEPTKSAPATFTTGIGLGDLNPAVAGGQVTGSVLADSTEGPVPRVSVEVFDVRGELVTATATDDDGTYELAGLLPARYRLRFRAEGFATQWWPGVAVAEEAEQLSVGSTEPTDAGRIVLPGTTASLGGSVVASDGTAVPATVQLTPLDVVGTVTPVETTTDEEGVWRAAGLVAPATYRVVYEADGYAPVESVETVAAGEELVLSTVRLPAAPGAIAGLVQDRDGSPIGGAELVVQGGDAELATTTPTAGEIGTFELPELATPGTYLLTVSAEGFSTETLGVRLGPGESVRDLTVILNDAAGTVVGSVRDAAGQPLGGATVTVAGGGTTAETDTLTSGAIGTFRLPGLPLPGVYTVTASLEGYGRQTTEVSITPDTPQVEADLVLTPTTGRLTGLVVDGGGAPVAGAEVAVSDGAEERTTTTASAPADREGRFSVGELRPGSYTITVRTPDGAELTALEEVTAGSTRDVRLEVGGG
ncbi:MAG: carboxypeptidase regulatory-like domain-containing protein [Nitriliruptoraceae bacterium]